VPNLAYSPPKCGCSDADRNAASESTPIWTRNGLWRGLGDLEGCDVRFIPGVMKHHVITLMRRAITSCYPDEANVVVLTPHMDAEFDPQLS
jgi:hypothetical protein